MSILKRYYSEGNTYFIVNVTYKRNPILLDNIGLFWQSLESTKSKFKFEIISWAILPEHFNMIITPIDCTPAEILHRFKLSFGALYRKYAGLYKGRIWQRRFWDHIIRNDKDLNNHIDYIHYNPVKHGLVTSPFEYPHSSIHDYLKEGITSWIGAQKNRRRLRGALGNRV